MAKLVVLSEGLTGQSYELKVDKTTVGRVEDNTFQIAQSSVSSHHCEILLRGTDIVIKDLNSTNGTFINGARITGEGVLKPGQILKLGEVEIRLDSGTGSSPATGKKQASASTMLVQTGVSLQQLEQGPHGNDTNSGTFTRRKNRGGMAIIIIACILLLVIVVGVWYALHTVGGNGPAGTH